MAYRVELSPHARRSLDKVPDGEFGRIDAAILALKDVPRPHGVKKLKGAIHRLRLGTWRVIYSIDDSADSISVLDIVRRSERTYTRYPA